MAELNFWGNVFSTASPTRFTLSLVAGVRGRGRFWGRTPFGAGVLFFNKFPEVSLIRRSAGRRGHRGTLVRLLNTPTEEVVDFGQTFITLVLVDSQFPDIFEGVGDIRFSDSFGKQVSKTNARWSISQL